MKNFKTSLLFVSGGLFITLSAFTSIVKSSGEKWRTGSPWDGNTCSSCHNGGASIPAIAITAVPSFGADNSYVPGTSSTVNVTVSGAYPSYGFNLEILNSNSATKAKDAGVFGALLSANTQKYTSTNLPTTLCIYTARV